MSTADLELFGPPDADTGYPNFTTVLRGYDPEQVRDYVLHLVARMEALENEVEETKAERDAARRRYSMARDDAYGQLATRMADLLKAADQQADRVRQDADEESRQRITEARQLAQQIQREAEEEAERMRRQAEETLLRARAERDAMLGGLASSRDLAVAELAVARDHLTGIVQQLEFAMEVARSAQIGADLGSLSETEGQGIDLDPGDLADDLLGRSEGFEIMLPEFLIHEEPDQEDAEPREPAPEQPA